MSEIDTSTAAIEALLDGVTPGPWLNDSGANSHCFERRIVTNGDECVAFSDGANACFISASRYLVPALAAERDALKAEVERRLAKYDEVISDRPYIVGWNAGYDFAEYGDEERDVPDVVSELAAKKQKEQQQLASAEWKTAIETNLTRLTAQTRAQGMREAAEMIDPAIFDYPSVFMGGPSHRAKRLAEAIVAPILARAEEIEKEARNG